MNADIQHRMIRAYNRDNHYAILTKKDGDYHRWVSAVNDLTDAREYAEDIDDEYLQRGESVVVVRVYRCIWCDGTGEVEYFDEGSGIDGTCNACQGSAINHTEYIDA